MARTPRTRYANRLNPGNNRSMRIVPLPCAIPTADESSHSVAGTLVIGTLHPHDSATFSLYTLHSPPHFPPPQICPLLWENLDLHLTRGSWIPATHYPKRHLDRVGRFSRIYDRYRRRNGQMDRTNTEVQSDIAYSASVRHPLQRSTRLVLTPAVV